MTGTLFLVGVGPGDPELITLKAVRLLDEIRVVAYPDPGGAPPMALSIVEVHLNPHARLLPISLPMEVDRSAGRNAYDRGAEAIARHLDSGDDVAYLCEGDPLFYGSAMYLLGRLVPRFPVRTIPGITSLTAAAAAIGRPLAGRNEILKVLPAPLPDLALRPELEGAQSVAIIKVGRHFGRIRALLRETGHAQSAVLVEHASSPEQKVTPLEAFKEDGQPYFSIILSYRGAEGFGS